MKGGGAQWVKGQSGNPSGRPKSVFNSRIEFEKEIGPTIKRLIELRDNSTMDSVVLAACREILDRALGKSMQAVEMTGADGDATKVETKADPVSLARDIAFILARAQAATA